MRIPAPLAVVVGVLLGGLVAPYALRRERAAKAAFEYVPPPGFSPATGEARRKLTQGSTQPTPGADSFLPVPEADQHPERRAWVGTPKTSLDPAPRIVQVHNDSRGALDEAALSRIASEMAEHQRSQGLTYTVTQKRIVERADGARVGLIAWNVESDPSSPQPAARPRHAIQLSFPDNDGIAIVTAQFTASDDAVIAPLVEASVGTALGVAVRPPPFPLWLRLLAALGGAGIGYLLSRLGRSKTQPT